MREEEIPLGEAFVSNDNPNPRSPVNPFEVGFNESRDPKTRALLQAIQGVYERQGLRGIQVNPGESGANVIQALGTSNIPKNMDGLPTMHPSIRSLLGSRYGADGYTHPLLNHVVVQTTPTTDMSSVAMDLAKNTASMMIRDANIGRAPLQWTGGDTMFKHALRLPANEAPASRAAGELWIQVHETGHQLHFRTKRNRGPALPAHRAVSQYESQNDPETNAMEVYAEHFATYVFNPDGYRSVNPQMAEMFDKDLEDLMRFPADVPYMRRP